MSTQDKTWYCLLRYFLIVHQDNEIYSSKCERSEHFLVSVLIYWDTTTTGQTFILNRMVNKHNASIYRVFHKYYPNTYIISPSADTSISLFDFVCFYLWNSLWDGSSVNYRTYNIRSRKHLFCTMHRYIFWCYHCRVLEENKKYWNDHKWYFENI